MKLGNAALGIATLGNTVLAMALVCALGAPASANAHEEYNPRRAGHPLRVAAYAAHPVGVILDYLIFRPAWYLGGKEPIRTLVGRDLEDVHDHEPVADPDAEPVKP